MNPSPRLHLAVGLVCVEGGSRDGGCCERYLASRGGVLADGVCDGAKALSGVLEVSHSLFSMIRCHLSAWK